MVSNRSNGIYRGVVLAIAGLALIGASPKQGGEKNSENSKAKSETGQSALTTPNPVVPSVPMVNSPILERPCDEGKDNRHSDLCAQWKAADAASKAAWWAAFGTFVALTGTAGLYWQIVLTRRAVQDTGKATSAMQRQNDIAQEAQRPWVTLAVRPVLSIPHMDEIHFRSEVIANNVGHSPATHFGMRCKFIIRDKNEDAHAAIADYTKIVEQWRADSKVGPESVLLPNSSEIGPFWTNENVAPSLIEKVFEIDVIYPIILIAVFYRTPIDPLVIQTAWRAWRVSTIEQSGDAVSFFRIDKTFKANFLQVEPLTGLRHITATAKAT